MKKIATLVVVAVAVLAACGGDSGGDNWSDTDKDYLREVEDADLYFDDHEKVQYAEDTCNLLRRGWTARDVAKLIANDHDATWRERETLVWLAARAIVHYCPEQTPPPPGDL